MAAVRSDFERQLAAIRTPLIHIHESARSLRSLGELTAIGAAVRTIAPFDAALVTGLRSGLGDWRDAELDVDDLVDDPEARVAAYEDQGFNRELTDFPQDSFSTTLSVTRIDLGEVAAVLVPPSADAVPAYNIQAYQWLFVLERELRSFIAKRMFEFAGDGWHSRLPQGMLEKWTQKKAIALANGEPDLPLIEYADFSDYNEILLGRANWRECFQPTFKREEAVREAFNRLRPIRLVAAHMRILTSEDWLLLNIEVRRILRAIGVHLP